MTQRLLRISLCVCMATALVACGDDGGTDTDTPDSGPIEGDGGCDIGEPGCPCDDADSCSTGECIGGMCVDCSPAEEGCVCRSTGACNAGLRCDETSNLCEACPEGEEGCACNGDGSCDTGLMCAADVCVADSCTDGSVDCPCVGGAGGTCDSPLVCNDSGLCETCADDVPGCPCTAGTCSGGLVCDMGDSTCREARDCADLVADGDCDANQECEESTTGGDATCVDLSCVAGYRWDSATMSCVACVSTDCAMEPSCDSADPGDISATCSMENRACEENIDGIGECTSCLAGYTDVAGVCERVIACEDSDGDGVADVVCADTEYCDTTTVPDTPSCEPWPCTDMNTVEDQFGSCSITCTLDCTTFSGSTGRVWPFATLDDSCVCETLPGYFWDNGAEIGAFLCDADEDGYVRDEVRGFQDATTPDDALIANARCDVRELDRVDLQDEYGLTATVYSCDEGLLKDPDLGTVTCTPFPLRLFEQKRNDVPANTELETMAATAEYPAGGRRFNAAEINSLTKACTSTLGNYDDTDTTEDIGQVQPWADDTSVFGEAARLRTFSHFIELYTQRYVAPAAGEDYGKLVIAERSRCDADFPLAYADDPGSYASGDADAYWRNCERRRDPGYDSTMPEAGYDFAQFGCDTASGSCPPPPTPANDTYGSIPDPDLAVIRDHGLCELTGTPADNTWRGFNHHSQFKCVQVVSAGSATENFDRELSAFGIPGTLTFNRCQVRDCMGAAGCTDSDDPMAIQPWDPVIECTQVDPESALPADGDVGWVSVRYQPYGHVSSTGGGTPTGDPDYNGGCINEDAEYGTLCPSPEFGYCTAAPGDAYGRYRCFGWDTLFLWADDDAFVQRSELAWAPDTGASTNMSVWNVDPMPSSSCN